MVELGRPGAMHPLTADSLRAALFTSGEYELTAAKASGDVNRPWQDPQTFEAEPKMEPAEGWTWHNAGRVIEGNSWGGNLEILSWLLMADREIQQLRVCQFRAGPARTDTAQDAPRAPGD